MNSQALIALLLAVSVTGVLWSTWRALLVDVDWEDCFARHPLPSPDPYSGLPYTTPCSPLGRVLGRWSQLRRWSESAPVEARGAWFTLPILPAVILVLSAIAGWQLFVLSLAALALSLIEWRVARRGNAHTALQAGTQVGLGWLAGHAVLDAPTWGSLTLACCFAIAYQGALVLARDSVTSGTSRRTWSLALLNVGQLAALGALVLLDRPLTAALVGLLLAPQWLLLAGLEPNPAQHTADANSPRSSQRWYLRAAIPFLLVAMLAAAGAPF
jgi:hypothetical protein